MVTRVKGDRQEDVGIGTNLLQVGLHNLGAIVDSQNNVSDTSLGKGLDLVLDHGLVCELDQRLGESQGLCSTLLSVC